MNIQNNKTVGKINKIKLENYLQILEYVEVVVLTAITGVFMVFLGIILLTKNNFSCDFKSNAMHQHK